jgi:hypothetical protein
MQWSLPVLYSDTSNIRPFPCTDEARLRLSVQEVERHLAFLAQELADLANMSDCEPSGWAERTATPKVRIEGIASYLPALAAAQSSAEADQRLQQQKLQRTCQDLQAFLRASAETLSQLSAPGSQGRQQRPNRGELRLRRAELQRHLMNLRLLFEDAA